MDNKTKEMLDSRLIWLGHEIEGQKPSNAVTLFLRRPVDLVSAGEAEFSTYTSLLKRLFSDNRIRRVWLCDFVSWPMGLRHQLTLLAHNYGVVLALEFMIGPGSLHIGPVLHDLISGGWQGSGNTESRPRLEWELWLRLSDDKFLADAPQALTLCGGKDYEYPHFVDYTVSRHDVNYPKGSVSLHAYVQDTVLVTNENGRVKGPRGTTLSNGNIEAEVALMVDRFFDVRSPSSEGVPVAASVAREQQGSISVRTSFEGYHQWPEAPGEVQFLRTLHRHVFHVKATLPTGVDDNRQLEFFLVQRRINDMIATKLKPTLEANPCMSCETMASLLAHAILDHYERLPWVEVTVDEDGENGSTVRTKNL